MSPRGVVLLSALFLVAVACRQKGTAGSKQTTNEPSPWVFAQPRIGIDVIPDDREITFKFNICGASNGEPFVDRLIVEKLQPGVDQGTVCKFESESADGVMRDQWRYGEKRRGVGRCWPLTEGEYVVVAIGSGAGQTRFSLKRRWFGSGYAVHILEPACGKS
jgi:hypothetical protein